MRFLIPVLAIIVLLPGCQSSQPGTVNAAPAQVTASSAAKSDRALEIFQAIWAKDAPRLQSLMDAGADPDAPLTGHAWKEVNGENAPVKMFALHEVLSSHELTLAEKTRTLAILKKGGANLDIVDSTGMTPLYSLAFRSNSASESIELSRVLLEAGANPNLPVTLGSTEDNGSSSSEGELPISAMLQSPLFSPEEKIELIGLFHRYNARFDVPDGLGMTLLYSYAVNMSKDPENTDLLRALLDNGADPNIPSTGYKYRTEEGRRIWISERPLHAVLVDEDRSAQEISRLIRLLLVAGADPNSVDDDQYSCLQLLILRTGLDDYLELIRLAMRSGADVRHLDKDGKNVLVTAFLVREALEKRGIRLTDALDALLSCGAPIDAPDSKGRTILFHAAADHQAEVSAWLVRKGAGVRGKDKDGNTVLHALFEKSGEIPLDLVRLLVEQGADMNARGSEGNTALFLAAMYDTYNAVLQYMVEKGADSNIGNDEGVAPLSIATQMGSKKNAAFLKSKGAVLYTSQFPGANEAAACKAVLSSSASAVQAVPLEELSRMVARTSFGVPATPLHLAAEQGDLPVVEALCARKVNWNTGDRYGRSPLQLAVLAGRPDIVTLLLAAGADPNFPDDSGVTALARASSMRPEIARAMVARGVVPKDTGPAQNAIWAGNLDLVKSYFTSTPWNQHALDFCAAIGQVEIAEYLSGLITHDSKTPLQIVEEARESRRPFESYRAEAAEPLRVTKKTGGIALKKGTFMHTMESWSPWLKLEREDKLKNFPIGVYVPKGYDGKKPFGLLVSMIHAKSSNQFPRPEFAPLLDKHNIIWAAFDPYNGVFETFDPILSHEAFCLAIVYDMLGYFSIDRSRIYMAGFSWGGRLTGEIVPKHARIFSGGIAIGGCFISGDRVVPALYYGQENITMVMAAGDYDFNRRETYNGFTTLLTLGYRNCFFIQEPMKGHSIFSAANFEKALNLLDAGARERAARK